MQIGKREIAAIVLCLAIIGASVAVIVLPLLDSIPFETVDQGRSSSIWIKAEYVITEEQEWETLWTAHHNYSDQEVPALPLANFTEDMIIAVFRGTSGAADEITIKRIVFNETHFVVYVDDKDVFSPLAVTTWPYHIVKISGFPQEFPVEFVYNVFNGF